MFIIRSIFFFFFENIIDASNIFFDVLSGEKIRKEKFSVVSKIYTKKGSKF